MKSTLSENNQFEINKSSVIYVAGGSGLVGSSCVRLLKKRGYTNVITTSSSVLDLRDQKDVKMYLKDLSPDAIINAAAKVGGIYANKKFPYQFIMDNMMIQNNLINISHELNTKKFIFLASSCIYPKLAEQPIKEKYLLSGPLESTNEWYAIAKISGLKACEAIRRQFSKDYITLMPTNLYGPEDNFDLETSHVIPALIRKIHNGKTKKLSQITLWGTGKPLRDFLHVDDLANAILYTIENNFSESLYNIGSDKEISIFDLAMLIKDIVGYKGKILWDETKDDGTPRKLLDNTKIKRLGWSPKINLRKGITDTYFWFLKNESEIKKGGLSSEEIN